LLKVLSYLQSSKSKLRIKDGFINENRAKYFKGKHAVNALCRDFEDGKIVINDRETGNEYMQKLLTEKLIIKVEKDGKKLKPENNQSFDDQGYYVLLYEGGKVTGMLMGIGVLIVVFIGVLFPLWPSFMRQGVYYLSLCSMGFLMFVMALGVIRLILWLVLVITIGRGGWLFPDLFADKGVIESFTPLWR
jgi:translocation protein SEC62